MSTEYSSGECVCKEEEFHRRTPHDSSSICNNSKKCSSGVCVCGEAEFRNQTLHGTVTVQQCPQSVRTCNNANQQPSANSSASWPHNKGGRNAEEKLERNGRHAAWQESIPRHKSRRTSPQFIQHEDRQFVFFFCRLTKPTAHTIRRGSLLEKQHGIIVGTALAQSVRNPPEMNNVGKRSNRRRT